jgi:hypothetical protein
MTKGVITLVVALCLALGVGVALAIDHTHQSQCQQLQSMYTDAVQNNGFPGQESPQDAVKDLNTYNCPLYGNS